MMHGKVMTVGLLCIALGIGAAAAFAQGDEEEALDGKQILADIELLRRLAPLNFTDEQLDQLLEMYAELAPAGEDEDVLNEATLEELILIKEMLLLGEELTQDDVTVLHGIMKAMMGGRRMAGDPRALLAELEAILTEEQMAILMAPKQPVAVGDKGRKMVIKQVLKRIEKALAATEEQWPEARERTLDSLVAGIADEEERGDARANLAEFLDRLRGMDAEQIAADQEELTEELGALLPEGFSLAAGVAVAPRAVGRENAEGNEMRKKWRALQVFSMPDMPRVLGEMKAAREG